MKLTTTFRRLREAEACTFAADVLLPSAPVTTGDK
jgi:Zn-dependent peptidase ImmA (M78 family)